MPLLSVSWKFDICIVTPIALISQLYATVNIFSSKNMNGNMDCYHPKVADIFGGVQVQHQIGLFLIMIITGYTSLNMELTEFVQRDD